MKRVLFMMMLLCGLSCAVMAQTDVQRLANLQKLVDNAPKACGIADVDSYASSAAAAALLAITNSKQLETYSKAFEEGNPPSLDELELFAKTIQAEKETVKETTEQGKKAAEALKEESEKAKSGNMKEKMAAGKRIKEAQKVLDYGNNATSMVTAESTAQALAIANLIAKVK